MPVEKSAGAIIIRRPRSRTFGSLRGRPRTSSSLILGTVRGREDNEIYYLLLHYPSSSKAKRDYWDLPKGHIEKGEDILDTVRREVLEETGLGGIEFIEGFKETIRYFFRIGKENILKFVTFFLAETKTKEIKISPEHIGYKWLPYQESLSLLTYENAKEILKKANIFIINSNSARRSDLP